MSHAFNYSAPNVAEIYDKMRIPQGVDVIAGLLQVYCQKPKKNIHILDAGCGTGHHAKALVDMGFGKITLLDASPEMLAIAREKLNSAIKNNTIDRVITHQFPPFPFEDGTFDAVMFNQSLQHVDIHADGQNYPVLEQTLDDTRRILKKMVF